MQTPARMLKLLLMSVTDALNSDRWRLTDPLSVAYLLERDNVKFHMWIFDSVSPLSATQYMLVAWGSGPQHASVIQAYGANDLEKSLTMVGSKIRAAMQLPQGGTFLRADRHRYPWIRFVTEVLAKENISGPPVETIAPDPVSRTVSNMLEDVARFGNTLDQTVARAIAHLSAPTASDDAIKNVIAFCLMIRNACRDKEMEAVYWPNHLWDEAIDGAEIFVDANVPSLYIPDGPQLWYFEHTLPSDLDPSLPEYRWWTPSWRLSCLALIPIRRDGREMCFLICILERERTARDSADDALPRILIRSAGRAGDPCDSGYAFCMAGQEFMQQVIQRTPFHYSRQVQRAAERRGEKLQPYSIMELRRVEHPAEKDGDSDKTQKNPGSRNYHHSFFQRRHRRRLNKPRKADGMQVVSVAAGQKLKHLPLSPESKQMVTKVRR